MVRPQSRHLWGEKGKPRPGFSVGCSWGALANPESVAPRRWLRASPMQPQVPGRRQAVSPLGTATPSPLSFCSGRSRVFREWQAAREGRTHSPHFLNGTLLRTFSLFLKNLPFRRLAGPCPPGPRASSDTDSLSVLRGQRHAWGMVSGGPGGHFSRGQKTAVQSCRRQSWNGPFAATVRRELAGPRSLSFLEL